MDDSTTQEWSASNARSISSQHWATEEADVVRAALRHGLPVRRSRADRWLIEIGPDTNRRRFRTMSTSLTTDSAVAIAKNKELTLALLARAGLPVPPSLTCSTADDAVTAAKQIGYPVVVKPVDSSRDRGVSIDLRSADLVRAAFTHAIGESRSNTVVVERLVPGNPHRLLVVDDKLASAYRRIAATLIGDGVHTISELIDLTNAVRIREPRHLRKRQQIEIDAQLLRLLAYRDQTLDSVPLLGEPVPVKPPIAYNGGTTINCTMAVHPDNAIIGRMAAAVAGLDVAGIDLITPDITRSVWDVGGAIIEVNSMPSLEIHSTPFEGPPDDLGEAIIAMLYPSAGTLDA